MGQPATSAEMVKAEIDTQSGRLEFLKQSLTLALAGIAGVAILFTDPGRIPEAGCSRILAVMVSVFLLFTAGVAYMGLSTYANLLKQVSIGGTIEDHRQSLVNHARLAFIGLALSAVAIAGYAGSQLYQADRRRSAVPEVDPSVALTVAWRSLADQSLPVRLNSFKEESGGYSAKFRLIPYPEASQEPSPAKALQRRRSKLRRVDAGGGVQRVPKITAPPTELTREYVVRVGKDGRLQSVTPSF